MTKTEPRDRGGLFLIYVGDEPRALTVAGNADQALLVYRQMRLGQTSEGMLTVRPVSDVPFEVFVRFALESLFVRMYQAEMAAMAAMQGGPKRPPQ